MIPKSGRPVFGKRSCANKRKRNAGRRIGCCPHASGVRDAPRSKAACAALRLRARSPAGVPLAVLASGTFVPKAQRRARLPKDDAKAAACRTLRLRSQRCTSHAGLSAGRHDARAARARTVSFRPRAPHSLRRQRVPSPSGSFSGARLVAVIVLVLGKSKAIEFPLMNQTSLARAILSKPTPLQ